MLQKDLHRRFVKFTAPGVDNHNAVMLAATALDVRYRLLLNTAQRDSARQFLEKQVSVLVVL